MNSVSRKVHGCLVTKVHGPRVPRIPTGLTSRVRRSLESPTGTGWASDKWHPEGTRVVPGFRRIVPETSGV
eukprot:5570193-Pyramimonas_sp.AAC.2